LSNVREGCQRKKRSNFETLTHRMPSIR